MDVKDRFPSVPLPVQYYSAACSKYSHIYTYAGHGASQTIRTSSWAVRPWTLCSDLVLWPVAILDRQLSGVYLCRRCCGCGFCTSDGQHAHRPRHVRACHGRAPVCVPLCQCPCDFRRPGVPAVWAGGPGLPRLGGPRLQKSSKTPFPGPPSLGHCVWRTATAVYFYFAAKPVMMCLCHF